MSVHKVVSLSEFPDDLLVEIFLKVPVKDIYSSCKRVSKHFLYVIEGPSFSVRSKSLVLLHSGWKNTHGWPYYQYNHFMLLMDETTKEVVVRLRLHPPPQIYGINYHPTVIGSCNGLICYAAWFDHNRNFNAEGRDFKLLIWNPVTHQFRYLPRHQSTCKPDVIEFGHVSETNDHVIVKVGSPGFNLEVYNMSTNLWRIIDSNLFATAESIPTVYRDHNAVFLNGSFHWAIKNSKSNYIVYYKLRDEKLGLINMLDTDILDAVVDDKCRGFNHRKLLVVDENLAMIYWNGEQGNVFEIWVMNDYGVVNSWTRRFQIGETFTDYMGYWANGLMLLKKNVLFFYDLKTRSWKKMSFEFAYINGFSSFVRTRVPANADELSGSPKQLAESMIED